VSELEHGFGFDPSYGYDLFGLLEVKAPPEPAGYAPFWTERYELAAQVAPQPRLSPSEHAREGFRVWDVTYRSTGDFTIGGWLLEPEGERSRGAVVYGHGYGGLGQPDLALPCPDLTYFLPCLRGLGRSAREPISTNPCWHVLHDIQSRDDYIIGGCVQDVWTGVSALLELRPETSGRIGFLGTSFGGGIGAMAIAWDHRIGRGALDTPTFGHQPLRLALPTTGSGCAVQNAAQRDVHVGETLAFYDSAVAARHIRQPMLLAAAQFDPVVIPPGQFAVYNALTSPKELFVRTAGHFSFSGSAAEDRILQSDLEGFFGCDDQSRVPPVAQPAP
jgi:cephalosporin-C deacetylase